jgi:hypothetical protein
MATPIAFVRNPSRFQWNIGEVTLSGSGVLSKPNWLLKKT